MKIKSGLNQTQESQGKNKVIECKIHLEACIQKKRNIVILTLFIDSRKFMYNCIVVSGCLLKLPSSPMAVVFLNLRQQQCEL